MWNYDFGHSQTLTFKLFSAAAWHRYEIVCNASPLPLHLHSPFTRITKFTRFKYDNKEYKINTVLNLLQFFLAAVAAITKLSALHHVWVWVDSPFLPHHSHHLVSSRLKSGPCELREKPDKIIFSQQYNVKDMQPRKSRCLRFWWNLICTFLITGAGEGGAQYSD